MSRVCIVFDRLRTEEKMLQKEASELGCECVMRDAKTTQINTDTKAGRDFGDVALERCVSYFRGLHFTACLEFLDVPVINNFAVAGICGNKMFMTARLKKSGVPTPKTYFSFSGEAAAENAKETGYPLVIKPVIGSWGRGVMPIRDGDAMDAILEIRGVTDGPHDRIYYMQEMVKRPPRDIRVITVGGAPVAAMYRRSSGFKTNLALDGEPELCKITGEIGELATRASEAVGGGILGVDMMEDESRGLLVHEVNNTVEFKGIAKVAEQNIPRAMVKFALDLVRK
ncbi:MAG: lysine biosynthesis protein LysX [Nitrosopumilus sp. H8]|nr:MAG: lysine biosynthesis protein LysX [Nitrosopumilus sp. H13]RNJ78893.1 MAG: lysine biosynthesis protein LysX [Nitrosopumilus sp. H8]